MARLFCEWSMVSGEFVPGDFNFVLSFRPAAR